MGSKRCGWGLAFWLFAQTVHADPPRAAGAEGQAIAAGATAPEFSLESTTGATRRRRNFAGRVMVIIYEDRSSSHQNDALKQELARRARESELATGVSLLPVADLHAYDFWPAAGFARSAVVDIAHDIGVEILMDWSGEMASAYGFAPGASHVVVVDRNGSVVFRHDGALDGPGRATFFSALESALQDAG